MSWLVTGGAGYIGAHIVRALESAGLTPVVVDDLSTGHAAFVPRHVPFVRGSVLDTALLSRTITDHGVTGVIHVAGYKYAGESVRLPLHTYEQNVTGTASVLRAMADTGVDRLVFSSSAAVYGTPEEEVVTEESRTHPESPYGESKLIGEWLIRDVARASRLRHTSLRYFNVVGSGATDLWDSSPHNLFPLVRDALRAGRVPRINGDDYPTPDGTCIRDYVDVAELAAAHVEAARALDAGRELQSVYNLGSGDGLSVRQIMNAFADVTGTRFEPEIGLRRPGDPARIVASGDAARRDLGWRAATPVRDMVASTWAARPASDRGEQARDGVE